MMWLKKTKNLKKQSYLTLYLYEFRPQRAVKNKKKKKKHTHRNALSAPAKRDCFVVFFYKRYII